MTNQEVINFLNQVRKILLDDKSWLESTTQPINKAFDIAISALQAQDLQSTCNNLATDTISRQAAIDELGYCQTYLFDSRDKDKKISLEDAEYAIEQLPSAQPEIIRCKNCKWWSNDDYRECSSPNYDDGYVTPAGFYCGYAERRTDERTD